MIRNTVSRRGVMRGALAAGVTTTLGMPRLTFAADGSPATMVVVFLRGGADALSLVAPTDDPDYVAARAPELRVTADGAKPGLRLDQSIAPKIDFRLHPDAAPLAELYTGRQLAIVHAAGLTDGTRSHFVAQDLMDRGIAQEQDLNRTNTGWVTRLLGEVEGGVPVIGTSSSPSAALLGMGAALAVPDLRNGLAPPGGPQIADALVALNREGDGAYERAARTTLAGLATIDGHLPRGADNKVLPYAAEGGATYEETEAGRALRTVAAILKMDVGLRVACVDVGGWDTHEGQPGRFANAIRQLSNALAAFYADTARYHDRLTIVVMSEFGRRLRTNRSQGTDHGHGSVMLVMGGRIAGGRMLGRWPGLASHELDRGVDLAVTTDYRTVLAELIGADAAARAFPGFKPDKPLGLFA